jgi:hypothetical protein
MKCAYVLFLVAISILILSCGKKNPSNSSNGRDPSLEDLQPLKIGNWWKYERAYWDEWADSEVDTFTLSIADRHIVLGGKEAYMFVEDDNYDIDWLVIYDDELRLYEETPEDTSDYYIFLKRPIEVGTRWRHYSEPFEGEYIWSEIVSIDETLHIPNATYENCVHVRTEFFFNIFYDAWYAKNAGAVQWLIGDTDSTWSSVERLIGCYVQ